MSTRVPTTFHAFFREFPDNDSCLEYLFKERHGYVKCPKCGRENHLHKHPTNASYVCVCGQFQIYPRTGTIFEDSRMNLSLWFLTIFLVATTPNGVNAKEIMKHMNITYKTAWRTLNLIRQAILANTKSVQATPDILKRIQAKYHSVADGLLNAYIAEFQFRDECARKNEHPFPRLLSMIVHTNVDKSDSKS